MKVKYIETGCEIMPDCGIVPDIEIHESKVNRFLETDGIDIISFKTSLVEVRSRLVFYSTEVLYEVGLEYNEYELVEEMMINV